MATKIVAGTDVWVASDSSDLWVEGSVVLPGEKSQAIVELKNGEHKNTVVYVRNPNVEGDMTALWHIHEPGILYNLEQRSWKDKAYTFMGPVLVAVNPLKRLKDPEGALGSASAVQHPHPFAIAETAYQQLRFAMTNKNSSDDQIVNQSVVVGGESGAGKTESSKMVLRHLVERCGGGGIDQQLLSSNPILESFGNASTLRNPNSSRFGKFMKLHFDSKAKKIMVASIEAYLLERSRITAHETGERGYHVFYQLVRGADKRLRNSLGITGQNFMYMESSQHAEPSSIRSSTVSNPSPKSKRGKDSEASERFGEEASPQVVKEDKSNFKELIGAFESVGMKPSEQEKIFRIVAAVLHLGNVMFTNVEKTSGNVASVKSGKEDAAKWAAGLLGLDKKVLVNLFVQRKVKAAGETVVSFRDALGANFARDAVAKAIYSKLFDFILKKINASFTSKKKAKAAEELNFIGVLDIFGFETFQRNDFEQLLINYTNEALQGTFNKQVFEAEAALYQKEGLVIAENEKIAPPPNNEQGISLLNGILKMIDDEGKILTATDEKLNEKFHRQYSNKNPCFRKVHPRERKEVFSILHYAGQVSYTVGSFLQKNSDRLPNEVDVTFETSEESLLTELWGGKAKGKSDAIVRSLRGKSNGSIVARFKGQIQNLVQTLNSTRCSFIRCVKPNARMEREDKKKWFDRGYVSMQLRCLSIPQTAEVLKSGLPTRIPYATLVKTYKSVLPSEALRSWKTLGGKSEVGFVGALFWAFGIARGDYKLGLTRVFFRSGMLATLDKVLNAAKEWAADSDGKKGKKKSKERKEVIRKFRLFHARRRWRIAITKQISLNVFAKELTRRKKLNDARVSVQNFMRMVYDRKRYITVRKGFVRLQALRRGMHLRAEIERQRKKENELMKKKAAAKRARAKKANADKIALRKLEEEAERLEKENAEKESKAKSKEAKERHRKLKEKARKDKERKLKERQKVELEEKSVEEEAIRAEKEEKEFTVKEERRRQRAERDRKRRTAKVEKTMREVKQKHDIQQKQTQDRREARRSIRVRSQRILMDHMKGYKAEEETAPEQLEPLVGYFRKRAIKSARNWKKRYFKLDRYSRKIYYYKKEKDVVPLGVFVLKGNTKEKNNDSRFAAHINRSKSFKETSKVRRTELKGGGSFVLAISHGYKESEPERITTLFMGFPNRALQEEWARVIQDTVRGYKAMARTKSQAVMRKGGFDPDMKHLKQLEEVERALENGQINQRQYEKILPTLLQEYEDSPTNELAPSDDVTVQCSNPQCNARDMTTTETTCRTCGSPLLKVELDDDVDPPEPDDALKCGELPLHGGVLKVFYIGYSEVLDHYGYTHIVFVVVCRWEKEGERTHQWICNYWYSGYRSLRKNLKQTLTEEMERKGIKRPENEDGQPEQLLPKLPKRVMGKGEGGDLVMHPLPATARTKYLSIFLVALFNLDIAKDVDEYGSSRFLLLPDVDHFFEINTNLFNDGSSTGEDGDDEAEDDEDDDELPGPEPLGDEEGSASDEERSGKSSSRHSRKKKDESDDDKGEEKSKKSKSKKSKSSKSKKHGKKKKKKRKKNKETPEEDKPLSLEDVEDLQIALNELERLTTEAEEDEESRHSLLNIAREYEHRLRLSADDSYRYENRDDQQLHEQLLGQCKALLKEFEMFVIG